MVNKYFFNKILKLIENVCFGLKFILGNVTKFAANNEIEKIENAMKNMEKRQSNYYPVKFYNKLKKDRISFLEDKQINTFEKLDEFIENKINNIVIDKEYTCI
jgi:hypothetical protein